MNFLNPEWLILLISIPILYLIYKKAAKKKTKAAIKFSNLGIIKAAAKKSNWRKHISFILLTLAVTSAIIAIADPHIPLKRTKEGVNVVLALDVSGSMKATDYKPTRIEAAKMSAKILIDSLKIKDNIGIVIFEDGATTASYLTQLKDRAQDKLSSIVAKDGRTAIGDGLALAVDMITSIPNKKKLIILLSDGVNNAGIISPEEAIKYANDNEIQVYTIGMGSIDPVILGYDWFGNPQYSELDETLLREIAVRTGGEYFRAVDDRTLNQIYESLSSKIKREKEDTSIKDWFIVLSILFLAAEFYFRYGKYQIVS